MALQAARKAYRQHRNNAKARGIEWGFTFETWLAWWGEDFHRRGKGQFDLQMQRVGDQGPYSPDNVRKGTQRTNAKTRGSIVRHRRSLQAKAEIHAATMAAPFKTDEHGASGREKSFIEHHLRLRSSRSMM